MKKFRLVLFISMFFVSGIYAERAPFRIGGHAGTSMMSPEGYSFNIGVQADYPIIHDISVFKELRGGFDFMYTDNFKNCVSFNTFTYAKWLIPIGQKNIAPFAQTDIGLSVFAVDDTMRVSPYSGIVAGVSFKIGHLYIDSGFKFGYPYIWGADLAVGYSFN